MDEPSSSLISAISSSNQLGEKELSEVIDELSALKPRSMANEKVFARLKAELANALISLSSARNSSKLAMKPPLGESSKVNDLVITDIGGGAVSLSWSYRNSGDYDQSGTVDIADIFPLADHFFHKKDLNSGEWDDELDEPVDGDGSGKIDINDIFPIADGFFSNVSGYRVLGSDDPAGEFSLLIEVPFSSATGTGRLVFVVASLPNPPAFLKIQPFDSLGNGGIESSPFPVSSEEPPHILSITPISGQAGSIVTFAAEVVGTPPFTYLWNFGNLGTTEDPSLPNPQVSLTSNPGTYPITLEVSNSFGSDSLTVDFEVIGQSVISLSLGEVLELPEVAGQGSWLLSTSQSEEYALVLSSLGEVSEGGAPPEFSVTLSYGGAGVSSIPRQASSSYLPTAMPNPLGRGDTHSKEELERIKKIIPRQKPKLLRKASALGESRLFSFAFNPSVDDKPATLRAEASLVELWVDDRVPSAGNDGISDTSLADIVQKLNSIVLPREFNSFGALYDPDNDGKLLVLFTPEINTLPGTFGGFFSVVDFFPPNPPEIPKSNIADVVYVEVPDPSGTYDPGSPVTQEEFQSSVTAIIAHELQHLINSANRIRFYQANGGEMLFEEFWLNEALSHFAEDFTGFQSPNNFTSPENFLSSAPWVHLPGGDAVFEDNPIPERRGAGYLFLRFLVDRYGEEILPKLLMRDEASQLRKGWENVETSIGEPMEKLLLSWGMAMMLGGLGVSPLDPAYAYASITADPATGAQHGVRFRSLNQPYSGDAELVTEPLYFALSPDAQPSLSLSAKLNTLLFFRLASISPRSPVPLTISASAGKPVRALLARVDTGEIFLEGLAGMLDKGCILGELTSSSETDTYHFLSDNDLFVFRILALSPEIENFRMFLVDTEFPNSARNPYDPARYIEGYYLKRIDVQVSGSVELRLSSTNGGVGAYALQLIKIRT